MGTIRQLYRKIDDWAWGLSRGKYAILAGFIAGLTAFAVSVALGDPNYVIAITMSLTLTVFYYCFSPNQKEE